MRAKGTIAKRWLVHYCGEGGEPSDNALIEFRFDDDGDIYTMTWAQFKQQADRKEQ